MESTKIRPSELFREPFPVLGRTDELDGTLEETLIDVHRLLRAVGDACGIEPEYSDNWGKVYRTPPDTAVQILEAKGIRIDITKLSTARRVLVMSRNEIPTRVSLYFDTALDATDPALLSGHSTVTEENGLVQEAHYSVPSEDASLGIDSETGLTQLTVRFPRDLEPGCYRFRVNAVVAETTMESELMCFICPDTAYMPPELERKRLVGISLALYGVRSESNWGIGDFGDLRAVIDWASEDLNVDFVGLNPLHALFNTRPFNSSPYNPSSRFFRNFVYLDVPHIPEFAVCARAKELVESPDIVSQIEQLRQEPQVNYEEVARLKLVFLREIFLTFMENQSKSHFGDARWDEFQSYVESEGIYLERYAVFCAMRQHFQSVLPQAESWHEWPEAFQDPESYEVKQFRVEHEDEVLFWMFLQWQLDEQLGKVQEHARDSGMALGLYHDEALAVDRNGADVWAWKEFFHDGFRVGVPPDAFAPEGQDWGFPPPNSDQMHMAAYEPFLKKLSTNCRHCGALRIDHVMQLHHLFWIPSHGKPRDGVYVRNDETALLNLLALVSRQSSTVIIGEDLGTVPFDFRDRLMAKGIFSYRLFYFERDHDNNQIPGHAYPERALVSISTHDLPTLAGFWSEADILVRKNIGQLDDDQEVRFREDRSQHKAKIIERLVNDGFLAPQVAHAAWESILPTEELHAAVLGFLFHTPSKLVVINQEDVLLDVRQQNFPGTTWENPNWVTKMRYTVEELRSNPEAVRLSRAFRTILRKSGRSGAQQD
ncbi:MAG TPA: 4-alpha-glucanotransferase [Desulfomonilaceae bacterium]|nr:4-alpha-glucanotransferase [Desulfomonilaceae bacterium]